METKTRTPRRLVTLVVDKELRIWPLMPDVAEWLGLPDDGERLALFDLFPTLLDYQSQILRLGGEEGKVLTITAVSPFKGNQTHKYTVQIERYTAIEDWLVYLIREIPPITQRGRALVNVLSARNRTLSLLNQAGQALTAMLDSKQVLERLLQVAIEIIGAEGSSVWLFDENNPNELVCHAAYHFNHDPQLLGQRLVLGQGVAGWAAKTGQSAVVNTASVDRRFFPEIDAKSGFSTRSLLAIPLVCRQNKLGVLEVVNKIAGEFDEDDLAVAETLAASAAIAIDNAQLVERLKQQAANLESRNDELDAFAHTVAHDLQNPLSLISGFAALLKEDEESQNQLLSPVERKQVVNSIVTGVHRMSNIVQELLLLSSVRKMEVESQPLDMAKVVELALARLTHMVAEHNGRILLPDSWPAALGYAPWVEEVWDNLISNALKYGGRPPEVILGATELPDGMVRFWVRDNGRGLSKEEQERLFAPFTKLSEVRVTGHGLGLSIVRRIVEKLGGEVSVTSTVGEGSEFGFTLPALKAKFDE
ncbi:MAG: hypothetical protein Kow0080_36060 [Candidatus Promineifilaceae bacterium]